MRNKILFFLLLAGLPILFFGNLVFGSIAIPFTQVMHILTGQEVEKATWTFIVLQSRLPQAVTAICCGISLATAGLLLQTYFNNPLAGPSVLGISNGASLGVAIVMLSLGSAMGANGQMGSGLEWGGSLSVILGAFLGALLITLLYLFVTNFVKNNLILLIMGIMVGYLSSSAVTLLNFFATVENVHSFVSWGMGSFSNVSVEQLPILCSLCLLGLLPALLLTKTLNALLLGEDYARNLGINLNTVRRLILVSTGLLTAVTTAFCGPVSFIGLAVPHIARLLFKTNNHKVILPATLLTGAIIALLCNLVCVLPAQIIVPLNAVTPLFGAPVIIYIIFRKRS